MTVIRIAWAWDAATLALIAADGYDAQRVEAELDPVGAPGVWTVLTRATTRPPLVADVERYLWEAPAAVGAAFRITPYRTSDDALWPTPLAVDPGDVALRGYATVADLRAEGVSPTTFDDARVQAALDYAMGTIDRLCGQRFDPYYARIALDVPKLYPEVHLDVPIAALWALADRDGPIDLTADRTAIWVSNRHLTQGLTAPDDRRDPRLAWDDALEYWEAPDVVGRFVRGRRAVTLTGVFGCTELGPADEVGEAAPDSQLPLSYGGTPAEIHRACMLLALRYLFPITSGEAANQTIKGRAVSQRTRDQSITLQSSSSSGSGGTPAPITGDVEVDAILQRYAAPVSLGGV